ncbi:MAG: T9SS type A sorting domain-containing protein, partial [Chitinophagaceae bacterium]|nr:T9SS type A sorting domain-containing protein [Chitinophagaceae bacterium]
VLFIFAIFISLASNAQSIETNSNPINILDNANSSLYASNINVTGYTGVIFNLAITLNGFSHSYPGDVSIVLQSPSGQKLLIQDACFDAPASNRTYTISDAGAILMPSSGSINAGGSYRPTSHYGFNFFNAPGPGATYSNPGPANSGSATFASTFNNVSPNGIWKLWVRDFSAGDVGSISGGWSMSFTAGWPLPVTFLNPFKAICDNGKVQLSWATNYEVNFKEFEIQRSLNGTDFETLSTIASKGNGTEVKNEYELQFPYSNGFNYYRLKNIDIDNKFEFSNVLKIDCSESAQYYVNYNDAMDIVYIHNPLSAAIKIEVYNSNGQLIEKTSTKSPVKEITSANLASGIYFIKVIDKSSTESFKIMKN